MPQTEQSQSRLGVSDGEAIELVLADSVKKIEQRRAEILELNERFTKSFPIVRDLSLVNKILSASLRPDLVIAEHAPQKQYIDPQYLNNFASKTQHLFCPITQTGRGDPRPLQPKEFEQLIEIGGRSFEDSRIIEQALTSSECIELLFCLTIGTKPAFVRMLIVIPDFAQSLLNTIIEAGCSKQRCDEELLVAYTLMSQLVSTKDPFVAKEGGWLDDWILCR
jgi:hypothetical protein